MVSCDMCGRQENLVAALVEEVEMNLCLICSRFGSVLKKTYSASNFAKKKSDEIPSFKVVSDYAFLLRRAREKKKLSQGDFAGLLQEKESIVAKWELGKMCPSVDVARRLEKALGISLVVEDLEHPFEKVGNMHADGFTLGDFMKVRKKF